MAIHTTSHAFTFKLIEKFLQNFNFKVGDWTVNTHVKQVKSVNQQGLGVARMTVPVGFFAQL